MTTESVTPQVLHAGPSPCGLVRRLVAEVIAARAPITSCSPCSKIPRSKSRWA
jgi:hypothetical protein